MRHLVLLEDLQKDELLIKSMLINSKNPIYFIATYNEVFNYDWDHFAALDNKKKHEIILVPKLFRAPTMKGHDATTLVEKKQKKNNSHLLLKVLVYTSYLFITILYALVIFFKTKATHLVLSSDRQSPRSLGHAFMLIARAKRIKCSVKILAMPNSGIAIRRFNKYNTLCVTGGAKLIYGFVTRFSKSTLIMEGYPFYRPEAVLPMFLLGLLPKNPWVLGGSSADEVCVSNLALSSYLQSKGIAGSAITVDATLHEQNELATKRAILKPYHGRKFTVISLPPLWEHKLEEKEVAFRVFRAVLEDITHSLKFTYPEKLLLSLHPKQNKADYEKLANTFGLTILDEKLTNVLQDTKLLIVGNSTVINVAISTKTPVILMDLFNLENFYFPNLASVFLWCEFGDFGNVLKSAMASDMDTRHDSDIRTLSLTPPPKLS